MRKRTAPQSAFTDIECPPVVVIAPTDHKYCGQEGRVLLHLPLPGNWQRVEFSDKYIGIFQPQELAPGKVVSV